MLLTVAVALKKTIIADLFFSPVESLGVLIVFQAISDRAPQQ